MIARLLYAAVALCILGTRPEHAADAGRSAPAPAATAGAPAACPAFPRGIAPAPPDFANPRIDR